jgi:maltooligosyltrehalose trehalohydrolase
MLFMGQEWSASTPFRYFTDHKPELGRLVTKGRRAEFRDFAAFADPAALERIPDPQSGETFISSKLKWDELDAPDHAPMLRLYREFLELRRTVPALRDRSRERWRALRLNDEIAAIIFDERGNDRCLVLIDLIGGHESPSLDQLGAAANWKHLLSSNEQRFGGNGSADFREPTVLVLAAS